MTAPVALDPEDEVVVLPPGERLDSKRKPIAGGEPVRLGTGPAQQPGEVGTAAGGLLGSDTVLLHEIVLTVGWEREYRRAQPPDQALVPWCGEHDHRLSVGYEFFDLARHRQRVEEQQALAVVDRVGRDLRAPRLTRCPVRMPGLPVPQARP